MKGSFQLIWGLLLIIQSVFMFVSSTPITQKVLVIESVFFVFFGGLFLRRFITLSIIFIFLGIIIILSHHFPLIMTIYQWLSWFCLAGGIILILLANRGVR